ncbi:MAG: hypothetical protein WDW36_003590 [Sanguina aurantia]
MRLFFFRLIGILEIAGGFYGLVASLGRLLPLGSTHASIIGLIGVALFGFVLVAGLPLLATPVFSYALSTGAFVNVFSTVHIPPHLVIDWHFGTQGFVLALAGPAASRVGINLLALLSWLALRLR